MSEAKPNGEFEWVNAEQINKFDVTQITDKTETVYILEVDLDYPPELHALHSDYPLAPESTLITKDQLSPYQISFLHDLNMKPDITRKLVSNLYNKSKYVTNYRNLQLYTKYGMKITKIHRILQFKQRPWWVLMGITYWHVYIKWPLLTINWPLKYGYQPYQRIEWWAASDVDS